MTSLPIQRHKPLYEGNGMCLCVFDILRQRPIFLFRKCPTGGEATRHYTPDDTHYNLLLTLRPQSACRFPALPFAKQWQVWGNWCPHQDLSSALKLWPWPRWSQVHETAHWGYYLLSCCLNEYGQLQLATRTLTWGIRYAIKWTLPLTL